MDDNIVGVPLKRDVGKIFSHPLIKREMQKHVGKNRTGHATLRRAPMALLNPSTRELNISLQPTLNIQRYPSAIREPLDRSHHQRVINAVKERPNIEIQNPIMFPTPTPSLFDRLVSRSTRPIPVRVRMERTLYDGLQIHLDDGLRYPISNSRNTELSCASVALWNLHPQNGRRKVRAGTQTIPDSIEVVSEIFLELLDTLTICTRRSLVHLYRFESGPHHLLRDVE
jgi:hypothetical protein